MIESIALGGCIPDGYTQLVNTVGGNIAAIRDRIGLSQAALADRLGVRQPSVAKVEKAKALPHGKTLLKYAAALGCSVDALLDGVDEMYQKTRRDPSRHSGAEHQTIQQGVFDATSAARVLALEGQLAVYKTVIARVRTVVEEAVAAVDRDESRATSRQKPKRGRRH